MKARKFLFNALHAKPEHGDLFATHRACAWQFLFALAVMATNILRSGAARGGGQFVANHACITAFAAHEPSAMVVRASNPISITAPIEKYENLPVAVKRFLYCARKAWPQEMHAPIRKLLPFLGKVNDFHVWQSQPWRTVAQDMQGTGLSLRCVEPTL